MGRILGSLYRFQDYIDVIASINYQLNLGYLFTFLLAGCAAAGV